MIITGNLLGNKMIIKSSIHISLGSNWLTGHPIPSVCILFNLLQENPLFGGIQSLDLLTSCLGLTCTLLEDVICPHPTIVI